MSAIVDTIRYEVVQSIRPEFFTNSAGVEERTGAAWVEFDPNAQNIQVKNGDNVTLECDDVRFNGIYKVEGHRDSSRGYKEVRIDLRNTAGPKKNGVPIWVKLADFSGVSGKIYFGKRNVITTTGGTATQILNNDVFKVLLGIGLLIVVGLAASSFFNPSDK